MKPFVLLLGFTLFLPVAGFAADHPAARPHGWNMEHCMPGMEAHCRMNQAMEQMEKEMDQHRAMEHCMPKMTAHCQAIADLEYMEKRMESMRMYMGHCMENEKDCPMPEMVGEMKAMRERMDKMSREMQEKIPSGPDEKGQIDTLHERVESHEKP